MTTFRRLPTALDRALEALKVIDRCIDDRRRPDDAVFGMLAEAMDEIYGRLPPGVQL